MVLGWGPKPVDAKQVLCYWLIHTAPGTAFKLAWRDCIVTWFQWQFSPDNRLWAHIEHWPLPQSDLSNLSKIQNSAYLYQAKSLHSVCDICNTKETWVSVCRKERWIVSIFDMRTLSSILALELDRWPRVPIWKITKTEMWIKWLLLE